MTEPLNSGLGIHGRQLLGQAVRLLRLDHDDLKSRTARRFFSGAEVNTFDHNQIMSAVAESLLRSGILPESIVTYPRITHTDILKVAIEHWVNRWDQMIAFLQNETGGSEHPAVIVEGIVRLQIIDLSLRVFSALRLGGTEIGAQKKMPWARKDGTKRILRALVRDAGITRDQLAREVAVSETTVDNWLDGKALPSAQNAKVIAGEIGRRHPKWNLHEIENDLRLARLFSEMGKRLEFLVDSSKFESFADALVRFVYRLNMDVRRSGRPPIQEVSGLEAQTLVYGVECPQIHSLLENLARKERDPEWKRYIRAANQNWRFALQALSAQAAGDQMAAGLAQEPPQSESDPPPDRLKDLIPKSLARLPVSSDLREMILDIARAADSRRALVKDYPLSARAHMALGSFLGMMAKHRQNRQMLEEGIAECHIAAELAPGWDNPAVEPGIILANVGEFNRALEELDEAESRLGAPTPHLNHVRGYVLMELGRHGQALENFESAIESAPEFARAYLYGARCAFAVGDKRAGIRYAKAARRFGEPGEYIAWKLGKYR